MDNSNFEDFWHSHYAEYEAPFGTKEHFKVTFEAGQRKPKVKGLEWAGVSDFQNVVSKLGCYSAFMRTADLVFVAIFYPIKSPHVRSLLGEFASLKDAKEACQSHHDELVMGLLA